MTSKSIYFCVYRITNLVENKHYYGYKSSKIHPSKVIGITYFSSMVKESGKIFRKDQKENPQNYKYKIVQVFDTKTEALAREIKLHSKFNVSVNPHFYNESKQTSTGFDVSGKFVAKDKEGNIFLADINDSRRLSGEIQSIYKGHKQSEETKIKRAKSNMKNGDEKWKPFIKLIENSDIDFTKFGWVSKVSEILKLSPQKISNWMKRYCPDLYNQKCFKRMVDGNRIELLLEI